ncbi:MAG: hypothetical protein OEN56_04720 [Gemmatimonadota bacterium]|nr:hypothetical protein [Gemmatimonadota bacterium]
MKSRRAASALTVAVVVASGCQIPRFDGPQIQEPPPGFLLQPDTYAQRRTFPDVDVTSHTAWVHTDVSGVSLIYVDEHPVSFALEDVIQAREQAMAAASDPDEIFADIEALTIDGREAWGWYQRVESPRRGLVEVTYTAVVPYDEVSYALQFTSGEPVWKRGAPAAIRDVIGSFAIGRTKYNIPLIVVALGGLLFVGTTLRSRSKARRDRLRSINLVTIKRDEETDVTAGDTRGVSGGSPDT